MILENDIKNNKDPKEVDDAQAEDEAFRLIEEQQKSQVKDSDQGG